MVPKRHVLDKMAELGFRAVLFRMVPKPDVANVLIEVRFRAVLFRMVPKHRGYENLDI